MTIKSIDLLNFRLHKNTSLQFSEDLNYILGGNSQGKTSILEAIYYLCTTKSLSQASDSEVVSFNENCFDIKGRFRELTESRAQIYYSAEENKKSIFVDDKQIYKASVIIGKFPVVTLVQSDHAITIGAPAERRKFVDSVISQASETYLKILIEYNKILRQRSSLLSQIKEKNSYDLFEQLDAWTKMLITNGTEIVKHRFLFVKEFNKYVDESYRRVMDDLEKPQIQYRFLGEEDGTSVESNFEETLMQLREDELRRGTNLVGPHRDDFIFKINDIDLKKYGSQGQHKTFQIALRFAEFYYLGDTLSKAPIFLMDDIFGELDSFRARKISEYLKEIGQAFITITDLANMSFLSRSENDNIITVDKGTAVYA